MLAFVIAMQWEIGEQLLGLFNIYQIIITVCLFPIIIIFLTLTINLLICYLSNIEQYIVTQWLLNESINSFAYLPTNYLNSVYSFCFIR